MLQRCCWILLLLPFTIATWLDPWITLEGSVDSVSLDINGTQATLLIPEDVQPGSQVSRIHYVGSSSFTSSCTNVLRFDPNPNGNYSNVTLATSLDYESTSQRVFVCLLRVNNVEVRRIVVNVVDVNDNGPIFAPNTPTSLNFDENKIGELPDRFVATDADAGDNAKLKYSVQVRTGGEHFEMRTVAESGRNVGQLHVIKELNFEEQIFYILTITVEDPVGHNMSIQVILTVNDQNDLPPEWYKEVGVHRMSEATKAGTVLFFVTARDGDRGINDEIVYSLQDDSDNFEIIPNNGTVTLKKEIDRDVLIIDSFEIMITATEVNELSKTATTTSIIIIEDVNDNYPFFDPDGPYNMSVPENSAAGFYIGVVRAVDIDLANIISYNITNCDNSGLDSIQIQRSNGQVTVKAGNNIDREVYDKFTCTVKVTDSGLPSPLSNETEMVIHVLDVNDNVPEFVKDMQTNYTIAEDTANGTLVGRVEATDKDIGEFGKVNYLFYRINDEGGDHFDVDFETGEIRVRLINGATLDFEKKRNFSFNVEARDFYRPGTTSGSNSETVKMTIYLTDVNDNAPELPVRDENTCFASPSESYFQGHEVVTINGVDIDEPDTNNSRIEYLMLSQTLPSDQEPIFTIETRDNKGILKTTANLDGYVGDYRIEVFAHDFGKPQQNATARYKICVKPYNQHPPVFYFPGSRSTVTVLENNTVNAPLLWRSNNQFIPLVFFANDSDKGENGRVFYSLPPEENAATILDFFEINRDSGAILLKKEFVRQETNNYTIVVKATDGGIVGDDQNGGQKSATATLLIKVSVVSQYRPEFASSSLEKAISENVQETFDFTIATDKDNENQIDEDARETIYYYLIDGNREYFQVVNDTKAQLSIVKELDRENPPPITFVVIEASNDSPRPNDFDCSSPQINCSLPSYLTIQIEITDVNDNAPTFEGKFFGGISYGYQRGRSILTFNSEDADENDEATYKLSSEFEADESLQGLTKPFDIKRETNELLLNFDVQNTMKGYFRFNVTATDKASNENSTTVTVYVVPAENKVTFTFNNERTLVETHRSDIANIFTEVYEYRCVIEGVTENAADEQNLITTNVLSYFLDESAEVPVSSTVIDSLKNDPGKTKKLKERFFALGLDLTSVTSVSEPEDETQKLFMILFIVACIVVLPMIALVIVLLLRGSELNRKVKALTTTKFGSQDSVTNRIAATVPNTNLHALEGSNPIWSMEEKEPQDDNISESSGDSILIGVEDNPEFRNYQGSKKPRQMPDESAPMPFQNVSRRNPLLEMNDSPPVEKRQIKRAAPPPPADDRDSIGDNSTGLGSVEEDDDDNFDSQVNSNFSFGNQVLTEL